MVARFGTILTENNSPGVFRFCGTFPDVPPAGHASCCLLPAGPDPIHPPPSVLIPARMIKLLKGDHRYHRKGDLSMTHQGRIDDSSAWCSADIANMADSTVQLNSEVIREILELGNLLRSPAVGLPDDKGPDYHISSARADEPNASWPALVGQQLYSTGISVLSGFPVDELGNVAAPVLLRFASHVGELLPQDNLGSLIYLVQNDGNPTVRGGKTDRELSFHSDFAYTTPDLFGLLMVRSPESGGESLFASGHTIFNALLSEHPEVLGTLFSEFHFDCTEAHAGNASFIRHPVFRLDRGGLKVLYNRARIHRGHRIAGVPLTKPQVRALDAVDELLSRPQFVFTKTLRPGELIFVNNAWILHSRTAFKDSKEPSRHRQLLRVWLQRWVT